MFVTDATESTESCCQAKCILAPFPPEASLTLCKSDQVDWFQQLEEEVASFSGLRVPPNQ